MFDSHIHPDQWGIMQTIKIFQYEISTYAFFILLGILAAYIYYKYDTRHLNESMSSNALMIAGAALLFGTIGAKLPSFLELYYHQPGETLTFYLINSGRTIVGGLVGGFIGVKLIKRILKIKEKRGNQLAPAVAIGMVFGRLACFFRGCCYGIETHTNFGINFGDQVLRHPTQLYEASFHMFMFIVLIKTKKQVGKPGILLKYYFLAYFIFRFMIEYIRVNPNVIFSMSGYQFTSLILAVLLLMQIAWINYKNTKTIGVAHD